MSLVPDITKFDLKEIVSFSEVIKDQRALYHLYNSEGGILHLKGQVVSSKIEHIEIYVNKKDLPEELNDFSDFLITKEDSAKEVECSADFILKSFSEKTVSLSKQMMEFSTEIFNQNISSDKRINKSVDLINETITEDLKSINSCIFILRDKDTYTYAHSLSVYTLTILALTNFKKDQEKDIFWDTFKNKLLKVNFNNASFIHYGIASFLHDFGKTLLPIEILNKPGKLTDKEFDVIKLHPSLGVKSLVKNGIDEPKILQIVGNHHPAYALYTDQLENPLVTICNIIDVYDALRSKRPYKEPLNWEKTRLILEEEKKKNNWNTYIFDNLVNSTLDGIEKYRSGLIEKTQNQ